MCRHWAWYPYVARRTYVAIRTRNKANDQLEDLQSTTNNDYSFRVCLSISHQPNAKSNGQTKRKRKCTNYIRVKCCIRNERKARKNAASKKMDANEDERPRRCTDTRAERGIHSESRQKKWTCPSIFATRIPYSLQLIRLWTNLAILLCWLDSQIAKRKGGRGNQCEFVKNATAAYWLCSMVFKELHQMNVLAERLGCSVLSVQHVEDRHEFLFKIIIHQTKE